MSKRRELVMKLYDVSSFVPYNLSRGFRFTKPMNITVKELQSLIQEKYDAVVIELENCRDLNEMADELRTHVDSWIREHEQEYLDAIEKQTMVRNKYNQFVDNLMLKYGAELYADFGRGEIGWVSWDFGTRCNELFKLNAYYLGN